jgi:hypothetical protein
MPLIYYNCFYLTIQNDKNLVLRYSDDLVLWSLATGSNYYFQNKISANQVLTSTGFINNTGNAGPFYLIVKNTGAGGLQVV